MPERRKNNRLIINQIFSCPVRDIPVYGRRLLQARAQEQVSTGARASVRARKKRGKSESKFLEQVPDDNACRHRHIERMLRAVLRNLDATITMVYGFLLHAFHFIA